MTASIEDGEFVGAALDKGDAGFDATQYSFFDFGSDGGLEGGLEGALEEGMDAPPQEELAWDPDLQLDEDEDLSYASMFALGMDHGHGEGPSSQERPELREREQQQRQHAAAELSILQGAVANGDGHGVSAAFEEPLPMATPPAKPKPGSIALGGLLAGTPSGMGPSPLGQGTPFGSLPGSSSAFLGTPSAAQPQPQPQPQALQDPAIAHIGLPPQQMAGLHGMLPLPMMRPMSAQELEAQLLGGGGLLQAGPPGPPPYHGMPPPMPMGPGPAGHFPPHMQPPPPHGLPPPHHPMQPPPGFDARGNPMLHRPPPPPPHMYGGPPPPQGPPRPIMPGGGFGPEGMMQQGHHRPFPPPQHMQHPMPPPPLGAGMPRGQMHVRPGPGGPPMPYRPHMWGGPITAPAGAQPGQYGRPAFPPGFQQQQQQQPPTLAQRLRALNLADRHEADRFPMLRRRYYSKFMDHEEIESILYMQWKPLHMGSPYVEDYYYQAFVYKHYNRRNRRSFAPESVRELAPTEKVAPDQVAFVKLEGLGKVPFSNIRRPRPLMDLTPQEQAAPEGGKAAAKEGSGSRGAGEEEGKEAAPVKPLEQEPLLAARIMIEDCMALLLDVEDIDRIFVATGGAPMDNEAALRTRRVLLVEGFAVSLRLPESPIGATASSGLGEQQREGGSSKPEKGDGVFVRLMSLPKGKTLTARALRLLVPPPELQLPSGGRGGDQLPKPAAAAAAEEADPEAQQRQQQREAGAASQQQQKQINLRVLWAVMRNLRGLFGGKAAAGRGGKDAFAAKDDLAATCKLAVSATSLLRQLPGAQAVCDCLAAILAGDLDGSNLSGPEALLLPLFAPGHSSSDSQVPWLANVLEALLQRAAELDLLPPDQSALAQGQERSPAADELAASWQQQVGQLFGLLARHTAALHEAFQAGKEMGDAGGCAEVRALVPIVLLRTLLPHCTQAQQEELRGMLVDFGA